MQLHSIEQRTILVQNPKKKLAASIRKEKGSRKSNVTLIGCNLVTRIFPRGSVGARLHVFFLLVRPGVLEDVVFDVGRLHAHIALCVLVGREGPPWVWWRQREALRKTTIASSFQR